MTSVALDRFEEETVLDRLTAGEIECLQLVAKGMVSKEIARILDVSPHTVDARLRTATRKMGARNRFVAAQMLVELTQNGGFPTNFAVSNLIYEDLNIPSPLDAVETEASTGEGNGPAELQSEMPHSTRLTAEEMPEGWLKPTHPFAIFFGGENRLPLARRLMLILGISIGAAMAFTAVVNSLIGMSRLISPP